MCFNRQSIYQGFCSWTPYLLRFYYKWIMLKWYYAYSRLADGIWFWLLKPGWWLKSSRRKCCLIFWQTQKVLFIIMSNNGTACFLEHGLEITYFLWATFEKILSIPIFSTFFEIFEGNLYTPSYNSLLWI